MEPEGSLPHSQQPATCPYPEPHRSSPGLHIPLPEDPSLYYPPIYAWVSQVVSFPQVSPPKPCKHLSPPPRATCPTHLIILKLITQTILDEEYRSLSSSIPLFTKFCGSMVWMHFMLQMEMAQITKGVTFATVHQVGGGYGLYFT